MANKKKKATSGVKKTRKLTKKEIASLKGGFAIDSEEGVEGDDFAAGGETYDKYNSKENGPYKS